MKKRIISILLALSMTVSAGVSALAAPSDIPFEQRAMAVDTIKADKAIEAFESDLKKSNNYDKVFEDYKSLMDLSVEISDIMNLIPIIRNTIAIVDYFLQSFSSFFI